MKTALETLREPNWVLTHSPCRIARAEDPAVRFRVHVFCDIHGHITSVSEFDLRADDDAYRALAPVRRHIEESTPGCAPVTTEEAQTWGWWDSRADAEGVDAGGTL